MIKYPSGQAPIIVKNEKKKKEKKTILSAATRGMSLEHDINISNEYYLEKDICLITKRPTPINVVKVDYSSGERITDAYFERQSTTDYNGVYKGRYIDFEAKSVISHTSFPLRNISTHQIKHLEEVNKHGGIAFFIINFVTLEETYLLDAKYIVSFYKGQIRKSIPYEEIKSNGILIKEGYYPRLDYIKAVDELY